MSFVDKEGHVSPKAIDMIKITDPTPRSHLLREESVLQQPIFFLV